MVHQYSPPFTSRSFDDLHRFLGKDEMQLNEDETPHEDTSLSGGSTVVAAPSLLLAPPSAPFAVATHQNEASSTFLPASNEPITAESCATIAEESVVMAAAAEYSAYLAPGAATMQPSTEQLFLSELSYGLVPSGYAGNCPPYFSQQVDSSTAAACHFAPSKQSTVVNMSNIVSESEGTNSDIGSSRGSVTLGFDETPSFAGEITASGNGALSSNGTDLDTFCSKRSANDLMLLVKRGGYVSSRKRQKL
jgi:hypothetical protein